MADLSRDTRPGATPGTPAERSALSKVCAHCGEPLPPDEVRPDAGAQWCNRCWWARADVRAVVGDERARELGGGEKVVDGDGGTCKMGGSVTAGGL